MRRFIKNTIIKVNKEKITKMMIDFIRGVDINGMLRNEISGLHAAVVNSRENVVESLNGSVLMVKLLIAHGANVNAVNVRGGNLLCHSIDSKIFHSRYSIELGIGN
jgi:ankyrin repeat protein